MGFRDNFGASGLMWALGLRAEGPELHPSPAPAAAAADQYLLPLPETLACRWGRALPASSLTGVSAEVPPGGAASCLARPARVPLGWPPSGPAPARASLLWEFHWGSRLCLPGWGFRAPLVPKGGLETPSALTHLLPHLPPPPDTWQLRPLGVPGAQDGAP